MSQTEILDLIRMRPGITQTEIVDVLNPNHVSAKLQSLRIKGEITRVSLGTTWALFPTGMK